MVGLSNKVIGANKTSGSIRSLLQESIMRQLPSSASGGWPALTSKDCSQMVFVGLANLGLEVVLCHLYCLLAFEVALKWK